MATAWSTCHAVLTPLPRVGRRLVLRHGPHHATVHHATAILHHRRVHGGHPVVDEIGHFGGMLLERGHSLPVGRRLNDAMPVDVGSNVVWIFAWLR